MTLQTAQIPNPELQIPAPTGQLFSFVNKKNPITFAFLLKYG
jgi:hypothetical protein